MHNPQITSLCVFAEDFPGSTPTPLPVHVSTVQMQCSDTASDLLMNSCIPGFQGPNQLQMQYLASTIQRMLQELDHPSCLPSDFCIVFSCGFLVQQSAPSAISQPYDSVFRFETHSSAILLLCFSHRLQPSLSAAGLAPKRQACVPVYVL
jgi:hypothetical protein